METKREKTFKRELAVVMLAVLGGLFIWGVSDDQAMRAAEFLTLPIFGFAGVAFGMDAYSKQIQR